jgi:hypothetical protein
MARQSARRGHSRHFPLSTLKRPTTSAFFSPGGPDGEAAAKIDQQQNGRIDNRELIKARADELLESDCAKVQVSLKNPESFLGVNLTQFDAERRIPPSSLGSWETSPALQEARQASTSFSDIEGFSDPSISR